MDKRFWVLLLLVQGWSIAVRANGPEIRYADVPREELLRLLENEDTRSEAFSELCRRDFGERHAMVGGSLDFKICPQGPDKGPLYLVWSDEGKGLSDSGRNSYAVDNPAELFQLDVTPPTPAHARRCKASYMFFTFHANGIGRPEIHPLNSFEEPDVLGDLNDDGIVEFTEGQEGGLSWDCSALVVRAVTSGFPVLFAVAIQPEAQNVEEEAWGYQITDADEDGLYEIALGPGWRGRVEPEVVFTWDRERRRFSSPSGETGAHFRVLSSNELAGPQRKRGAEDSAPGTGPRPPFTDRGSLRDLDDAAILLYMGEGARCSTWDEERQRPNRLPSGIWDMDPKDAALALATENRSPHRQKRFLLAVDDRAVSALPDSCAVQYHWRGSTCYSTSRRAYALKADPDESFLALAGVSDFCGPEIHFVVLDYSTARNLAHMIGWLNQLRGWDASWGTTPRHTGYIGGRSTADGSAALSLRDGSGKDLFSLQGRVWADAIVQRFEGIYDQNACVSLVGFLLSEFLFKHLADEGLVAGPDAARNPCPLRTPVELMAPRAEAILEHFIEQPRDIPTPVLLATLRAVGDPSLVELTPTLEKVRAFAQIQRGKGKPSEGAADPAIGDADAERIENAVREASRKLQNRDCPEALLEWSRESGASAQWALYRLARVAPEEYAAELERRLYAGTSKHPRSLFHEILRKDPARARAIARRLPRGLERELTVLAFTALAAEAPDHELEEWIPRLLEIAADPKADKLEQRFEAIQQLVPNENPKRFADPRIDELLIHLLDPGEDEFLRMRAGRALGLRKRTDAFEQVAQAVCHTYGGLEVLGALAELAEDDPESLEPRVVALVRTNLTFTNFNIPGLIELAWQRDYRELKSDVERLATSGPNELEDARAAGSSGEPSFVHGRFHRARQVAALWNEDDPTTRARLLVAFGLQQPCFSTEHPDTAAAGNQAMHRLRVELKAAARVMDEDGITRVTGFLESYEAAHRAKYAKHPNHLASVLNRVDILRQALRETK